MRNEESLKLWATTLIDKICSVVKLDTVKVLIQDFMPQETLEFEDVQPIVKIDRVLNQIDFAIDKKREYANT